KTSRVRSPKRSVNSATTLRWRSRRACDEVSPGVSRKGFFGASGPRAVVIQMTRHRLKLVGVGLVTSGVFMVLAVRNLEIADVRQAFGAVEFLPWVPLAVLCYLVGHAVRGLRCRVLVRSEVALGVVGAT